MENVFRKFCVVIFIIEFGSISKIYKQHSYAHNKNITLTENNFFLFLSSNGTLTNTQTLQTDLSYAQNFSII